MHSSTRRNVVLATAGLLAAPLALGAQQAPRVRRIGFLTNGTVESARGQLEGFERGLAEQGYADARNIFLEKRYAEGRLDRLPALVAELLAANVDLVFAPSGIAAMAVKKSGTTLPIVFALAPDPVGQGFAQSLAHPGGNMTGMTSTHDELAAKRMQLLKEAFPAIRRVAVLYYLVGAPAGVAEQLAETERAAKVLGLSVTPEESPRVEDFECAFAAIRQQRPDALVVIENPLFFTNRARITELAAAVRIPAVYNAAEYVHAGGLMSFGASYTDLCRRAAAHVVRILKGAHPGDLPIERPTKFEFAFNAGTARAMGLALPPTVLTRADLVVE